MRHNWRVIGFLLWLFFVGLIAGAVARLIVRSPARLGFWGTVLLGIVGSYAGGTLGALLFHDTFDIRKTSGVLGAIVGAIVVLGVWRLAGRAGSNRHLTRR
jgi:uncharacterized membrane protein YeaQ/YmgE (transglycosylase-associated protein family)